MKFLINSSEFTLEIIEFIIEKLGSSLERVINIQNDSGNTPLHWSALNGHEKVAELLIKNGANGKVSRMICLILIYIN